VEHEKMKKKIVIYYYDIVIKKRKKHIGSISSFFKLEGKKNCLLNLGG